MNGSAVKRTVAVRARGLAMIAETFGVTSRAFLGRDGSSDVDLALDLGCGPGHTTTLLAMVLGPRRVVGLDTFAPFLALARSRHEGQARFLRHDVTSVPFPERDADLIYARFLMGQLPQPGAIVHSWGSQLRPGGRLLLEEVEWIRAANPTLRAYVELVDAMLDAKGIPYAGPLVDGIPDSASLRRRSSTLAMLRPGTAQVARMFATNLPAWRDDPWVVEHRLGDRVAELGRELDVLMRSPAEGEITWAMRQAVWERP